LHDLLTEIALGRRHTNQALAARWSIAEGTASKWSQEWQAAGLITRVRHGRNVIMAA
jgi:hypothetical protein